ncbi:conjugal transfer protein TraG (plasmid) [Candidatus Megaera polyxenophila]|nr:conjugal transfer protein TraG [Candidatus Megaera polyxenophila]
MGIHFAVHTYGHFEAMFYVLNGIKMIMNSSFMDSMIKLMALVTTSYYSLRGIATAAQGGTGHYFLKTTGMLILITSLLIPKADMLVIDRISGKKEIVSGLPYAFVLPVGILEAMGAGITSLFEQAFSTVSSMPYKDYGLIFGQRLVQESRNWRIGNPEFARNMNTFIKRCIVLEAMIGSRFTPDDVFDSKDIFKLVTERAGTFRQVDFRVAEKFERINCKEAGALLKTYLPTEVEFLKFKYKGSEFSLAGGSGGMGMQQLLTRNIEAGYATSFGIKDQSAADIIRQNLMINAIKDWGNTNDLYGYTRADDLQKSNWKIAGELAKEYLPLLLNIMKALIYASFIFMLPMMILSGGMARYLKYCTVVFSLQIWPALNAVLNLFIELYSGVRGAMATDGHITFTNFNSGHDAVDTIVLVASGLQMAIPALSYAIVQGGVDGFIHLASNIQGASNSAASIAAGEVTSGNRSFDNITQDTASIGNKSGFKTDFNQLYQEGATQVQTSDGSILRTFANGQSGMSSGAGVNLSSGSRSLMLESGKASNLTEAYTQGLSAIKGLEQHFQQAETSTIKNTTDLVSHLAQKQAAGENLNLDMSTEEGKAMNQAVKNTIALHDKEGYGWQQAAGSTVKAHAGVEGSIFGVSGGVSTEGTVSASNLSDQSLNKDNSINRENGTSYNLGTLVKAAKNHNWSQNDETGKTLSNNANASYEKMQNYGEALSQRREEVENYNKALQATEHKATTDKRDMTHVVEDKVMKQLGVSREAAHEMVQNADPRAEKIWNSIVEAETAKEIAQVKASKQHIEDNSSQDAILFKNEHSGKVNNQGLLELQKEAAKDGLDANLMNAKIQGTKGDINNQQTEMTENANNQIHSIEHHNKVMETGMNDKINQYEKDRIGQGWTADKVGMVSGIFGTGSNIGAPTAEQRGREYLQKAPQIPNVKPKGEKE